MQITVAGTNPNAEGILQQRLCELGLSTRPDNPKGIEIPMVNGQCNGQWSGQGHGHSLYNTLVMVLFMVTAKSRRGCVNLGYQQDKRLHKKKLRLTSIVQGQTLAIVDNLFCSNQNSSSFIHFHPPTFPF